MCGQLIQCYPIMSATLRYLTCITCTKIYHIVEHGIYCFRFIFDEIHPSPKYHIQCTSLLWSTSGFFSVLISPFTCWSSYLPFILDSARRDVTPARVVPRCQAPPVIPWHRETRTPPSPSPLPPLKNIDRITGRSEETERERERREREKRESDTNPK